MRKRKHDLRTIWNALFYIVQTGCQWRMLPSNFPKWQLVYYYYRKWSEQTDFDLLLSYLVSKRCNGQGCSAQEYSRANAFNPETIVWPPGAVGNEKLQSYYERVNQSF
jgi:hypothetical protein